MLRHVTDNYQYANAPRGNASRELIGASFQVTDPTARLPFVTARKVNPVHNVGEVLWYLAGRRDVAMISYYAPLRRGRPDGSRTDDSAYGPRVFGSGPGDSKSPFARVIDLLRTEKDSKRGALPIFTAADLEDPGAPEVPCPLALHLLLRDGRLHMVVYMRANDADRGLLADVFSFTFIQEFAARLLGADLGTYTHHVGSLHINDADMPRVRRVLAETSSGDRPSFALPAMPATASWRDIERVMAAEEALRLNTVSYGPAEVTALGLDPYWQQLILLLETYRQISHGTGTVDHQILTALHPAYRWLTERRWPDRMPGKRS